MPQPKEIPRCETQNRSARPHRVQTARRPKAASEPELRTKPQSPNRMDSPGRSAPPITKPQEGTPRKQTIQKVGSSPGGVSSFRLCSPPNHRFSSQFRCGSELASPARHTQLNAGTPNVDNENPQT